MMKMKEKTLQSILYKAKEVAESTRTKQFISWTEEIKPLSILHAFSTTENERLDRLFWSNSTRDFVLFGIGSAEKIIATEDDRFNVLEEKWDKFVNRAIINNP